MPPDLWSFALVLYARPGVEDACLRLQEQGHLPVEAKPASAGGGDSAWRALFKESVSSETRSRALSVAARIATIRALCSEAMLSRIAR